jgi:hypothetical protein
MHFLSNRVLHKKLAQLCADCGELIKDPVSEALLLSQISDALISDKCLTFLHG